MTSILPEYAWSFQYSPHDKKAKYFNYRPINQITFEEMFDQAKSWSKCCGAKMFSVHTLYNKEQPRVFYKDDATEAWKEVPNGKTLYKGD